MQILLINAGKALFQKPREMTHIDLPFAAQGKVPEALKVDRYKARYIAPLSPKSRSEAFREENSRNMETGK
jgi:hypothetical protein